MNVLFVCTGNTCRSPMAAGIFVHMYPQHAAKSAGLYTQDGLAASENAVEAVKSLDVDISTHVSSSIKNELTDWADVVVALAEYHVQVLHGMCQGKKVLLLGSGIDDPYGADLEAYKECAFQIQSALEKLKLD